MPQHPLKPGSKISGGAIAGIAVAIAILCILVIGAVVFIVRRRRARNLGKSGAKDSEDIKDKPELDGLNKPPLAELFQPPEEADSREAFKPDLEMDGSEPVPKFRRLAEAEGSHGGVEMEGSHGGAEMDSGPAAIELDAGPVPRFQQLSTPGTPAVELPSPRIPPDQQRLPSPGARSPAAAASGAPSPQPEEQTAPPSGNERARPMGRGIRNGPRSWGARRRRDEG